MDGIEINHPALDFLLGTGTDTKGRTFDDYMAFTHAEWEKHHDIIQWAFPTVTASQYNSSAPVLPADFQFDGNIKIKRAIIDLAFQYLNALNIVNDDANNGVNITKFQYIPSPLRSFGIAESRGSNYWTFGHNHNTRRLTRLLECLRIFDLDFLQRDLAEFLIYDLALDYPQIGAVSVVHWMAAWENKQHLIAK